MSSRQSWRTWAALAEPTFHFLLIDSRKESIVALLVTKNELLVVLAIIEHSRKSFMFSLFNSTANRFTFLADSLRIWRKAILIRLSTLPPQGNLPA